MTDILVTPVGNMVTLDPLTPAATAWLVNRCGVEPVSYTVNRATAARLGRGAIMDGLVLELAKAEAVPA